MARRALLSTIYTLSIVAALTLPLTELRGGNQIDRSNGYVSLTDRLLHVEARPSRVLLTKTAKDASGSPLPSALWEQLTSTVTLLKTQEFQRVSTIVFEGPPGEPDELNIWLPIADESLLYDSVFMQILKTCVMTEEIRLLRAPATTDRHVALLASFPKLRSVSLQQLEHVTDDGVKELMIKSNITRLVISRCPKISSEIEATAKSKGIELLRFTE